MSSSTEIRVPRETVNDDLVTIQAWHRRAGDRVREKDVVVSIETSKAVLEVEAESDGYLAILHPQGAEVPVGELIGRVSVEPVSGGATPRPESRQAAAVNGPTTVNISKKAQKLIAEYKIDPGVFAGIGLVRESDVIRHLEAKRAGGSSDHHAPASSAVGSASASGVSEAGETPAPPDPAARSEAGRTPVPSDPIRARPGETSTQQFRSVGLFGDARRAAGDRGKSLPFVIWNYFWRNWLLGNLVRAAPRGVITILHKWRGVKMGKDCFIDPNAILETAYPEMITMGNDVRVTVGAIIMCHIKAPHYLQDTGIMPPIVKPVVLEDHCFIGVNAVVMPGVTVGKASVVTSGSVVVSSVPAYCMVGGNPAKVIKRFPNPEGGT